MRFSRSGLSVFAVFSTIALSCIALVAIVPARSQVTPPSLPSIKIGTAAFIAPGTGANQGDNFYGTSTTATDGLAAITGHATPVPPEIVALANTATGSHPALKNDPDLIYQYVHNNIENEWTYGESKGALGAMIDKSGTAFDQAALMVVLLRQAGFTANIQLGTVSPSPTNFQAWTNLTEAQAACQMLSSGGIPGKINGSSVSATCAYASHVAITSISFMHAWVTVTIPGSSSAGCDPSNVCTFDPSFKPHTWKLGIARTATGITAGEPYNTATTGMSSGTQLGLPYVSSLDQNDLYAKLASYSANYLTYLKTYNMLGAQIEDIAGGGVIIPDYSSLRQARPSTYTPSPNFPTPLAAIPDQFRSKLAATLTLWNNPLETTTTLFSETFFADEIYGRRLSVSTNFNETQIGTPSDYDHFVAYLTLDDQILVTSPTVNITPEQHFPATLTLAAVHPYAAAADGSATATGTYMDESVTKSVTLQTPFSIVHAWGGVGPGLLAKWGNERVFDTGSPQRVATYGCDFCVPDFISPEGDYVREKAQASFLAQYTRASRIHAGIANGIVQLHHVLGAVYADDLMGDTAASAHPSDQPDYYVADTYTRFDIDAGISFTNRTSDPVVRRAALQSIAATSSAIEGSIMMQMADVVDVSSTATRFEWANAPPCPDTANTTTCEDPANTGTSNQGLPRRLFAFAPGATVPSGWVLWEKQVTPPTTGYNASDGGPQLYGPIFQQLLVNDIGAYTSAGFNVTTPQESFLGPGQRGGLGNSTGGAHPIWSYNNTKQRGGTLIATRYDPVTHDPIEIAHDVVGLLQGSPTSPGSTPYPAKGGGGGNQPDSGSTYNPNDAADVLKSKFVDRSHLFGVDLKTGTVNEASPASIETGNGGLPYSLSGSFDWKAGTPPQPAIFGPVPAGEPYPGWIPNWYSSLAPSGSGMEAMGTSDIRDAAAAVAAFVAEQDIYSYTDTNFSWSAMPFAQRDAAVALTQAWFTHQISGNVVMASVGKSARQFVRLPDSTWFEPGPSYATMTVTGSRALSQSICPENAGGPNFALSRGWNYNGVSYAITNAHGDVENFGFWVSHYSNGLTGECPRLSGFRLNSWVYPQGVTVNVTYAATTDYDNHMLNVPDGPFPSSSVPTGVTNTLGRSLTFPGSSSGITGVSDGVRSVSFGSASMTDPTGATTSFSYTSPQATSATTRPVPYQQLATITTADNPSHANIEYDYDPLGQVATIEDAYAILHPTSRGPYVFLIGDGTRGERDDPLGGAYSVAYDTYGHASRYVDEINRLTTAKFDSRSLASQYTYPEGDQELFGYDNQKNMVSYIKTPTTSSCTPTCPTPLSASAVYDTTWNKPLTVINFRGLTTTLAYYNAGNGTSLLHTATRPSDVHGVAPVYSFTYDAVGKPLTSVVPFASGVNIVTTNTYFPTSEDLQTSTLDAGTTPHVNATTTYGYDSYGNTTSTTDPRGDVTISFYDLNRQKTEDDNHNGNSAAPLIAASRTQYDVIGRDIEEDVAKCFDNATTCPVMGSTVVTWVAKKTTTYTPTSKIETIADASGATTSNFYDNDDRLIRISDPIARQTRLVYDAAGQKSKEIRAWSTGTACSTSGTLQECYATYTYGGDGEKLTEMDANGAVASSHFWTSYGYDGFLRLSATTFPDGSADIVPLSGGYDENGNILQHTNRAGQTEVSTYDNLDRVLTKLMPGTSVNPATTTNYDYYLNGLPSTQADTLGNSLSYGYDGGGRQISVSTAIAGLLSGVSQMTKYALDASGNRTSLIWPDNYCAAYGFDSLDRMTTTTEGTSSGGSCTAGSTILASYAYDAMSRRTNLAYPQASMSYTYSDADDLLTLNHSIAGAGAVPHYTLTYTGAHQLFTEASSDPTYVWQPAAASTDNYTAANRLNQYPSWTPQGAAIQSFGYDLNGNMTSGTIAGFPWTFVYDPENRLITANKTAGGTIAATYSYDTQNRRTHKAGTGVAEAYYLDDGSDEIAEYNSAGVETWRYVPGPVINEPAAVIAASTGARRYYLTDHHGSVVAAVNNAGAQIEGPYTYDTYGNCFSGGFPCSGGSAFKFVGMRYDLETGLYYDRRRIYSPVLGRFMQADPVGYKSNLNLYVYVNDDPNGSCDPTGLATIDCTGGVGTKNCNGDIKLEDLSKGDVILTQSAKLTIGDKGSVTVNVHLEKMYSGDDNAPPIIPIGPKNGTAIVMGNMFDSAQHSLSPSWFENKVGPHKPWDYKHFDKRWDNFGNFNYGASGVSAGFSREFLLRQAGVQQVKSGTSRRGWGSSGWKFDPFGMGSHPPYGDDPVDQFWIIQGMKYNAEHD